MRILRHVPALSVIAITAGLLAGPSGAAIGSSGAADGTAGEPETTGAASLAPGPRADPSPTRLAEAPGRMRATTRSNLRSGPGTDHARVGRLEAGDIVRVLAGEGGWWHIEHPEGGIAWVYGPLLEPVAAADGPGEEWSLAGNQRCYVWNYGFRSLEPFTWSGECVDGKASGEGRLTMNSGRIVYEGVVRDGRAHGYGITVHATGNRHEGEFRDGQPHGFGIKHYASGERYRGAFRAGKRHGRGTRVRVDGREETCAWADDEPVAGTCTVAAGPGEAPGADRPATRGRDGRRRAAAWLDGCHALWAGELQRWTLATPSSLVAPAAAERFLATVAAWGGPVAQAREYLEVCVPVEAELQRRGLGLHCRQLLDRIGADPPGAFLRPPASGRRAAGERAAVRDWGDDCLPVILAGIAANPGRDGSRGREGNRGWGAQDRSLLALEPEFRAGNWLFTGAVETARTRERAVRVLGRDRMQGQGSANETRLMVAVDGYGALAGRPELPPPWEVRDGRRRRLVSRWGVGAASELAGGIHRLQHVSFHAGNRRDDWLAVQHAIGLLQHGEFGVTRTVSANSGRASIGDAAVALLRGPRFEPGDDTLDILLRALVLGRGAEWKGAVLGFRRDGIPGRPVQGRATLTSRGSSFGGAGAGAAFDLVVDWQDGEQHRLSVAMAAEGLRATDVQGAEVFAGHLLGSGADEVLGILRLPDRVAALGLRKR